MAASEVGQEKDILLPAVSVCPVIPLTLAWGSSRVFAPVFLSYSSCLHGSGVGYQSQGHALAAKLRSASRWPSATVAGQGDPWV